MVAQKRCAIVGHYESEHATVLCQMQNNFQNSKFFLRDNQQEFFYKAIIKGSHHIITCLCFVFGLFLFLLFLVGCSTSSQWFSNGSADQRGSAAGSQGVCERILKMFIKQYAKNWQFVQSKASTPITLTLLLFPCNFYIIGDVDLFVKKAVCTRLGISL